MTITLSPSTVAKWEQGTGVPTQAIHLVGLIEVNGDSIRLVDLERGDYKIDIVDPRFRSPDVLREWPIKSNVACGLCVDIEWVLSTVRICRINELTVDFPIVQPNGIACLWPPSGPLGRFETGAR